MNPPLARRVRRRLVGAGARLETAPPVAIPVLGVPVQLDVSCLAAAALATWTLADTLLPQAVDGYPVAAYWAMGGLTALVLLASVAMHELAHGLAARRTGSGVRRVRLTLLGGTTFLDRQPATLRLRIMIALAGPLANLALAAGATVLHVGAVEIGADGLLVAATAVVAVANLGIGAINLLPAPPLDGGVVLHALLARLRWRWSGGIAAAALARRALGGALVGLVVLAAASGDVVIGLWSGLLALVVLEDAGSAPAGHGGVPAAIRTAVARPPAQPQRPAGRAAGITIRRRARPA